MKNSNPGNSDQIQAHQAEYAIIKKDLFTVLALNAVYLALILTLYFTNEKLRYLETLGSKLVNF